MISFLIGLLLTGVLFYTALIYANSAMLLLGFALAALVVLAFFVCFLRKSRVRCSMEVPIRMTEKDRPVALRLLTENRGLFPLGKLKYRIRVENRFLPGKRQRWLKGEGVWSGEEAFEYRMEPRGCGSYEVRLEGVRVYDLTGLFYLQKRLRSYGSFLVLPQLEEIRVTMTEGTRNFFGESDVYDDVRPGYDRSETFRIRPFQNGDKLQSIHWKLSAKMDDLVVREDSLPKACPVVLFLVSRTRKKPSPERVGAFLSLAGSISFSLMDAGCPHYVVWYSAGRGDILRLRVDSEEGLYLFLSCYLEDASGDGEREIGERYREKYRGERYLHSLTLNGELELYKNEELLARFGEKSWQEERKGLEILL